MKPTQPLPPPVGYDSWLAYAVATMQTRWIFHDHLWGHQPQWHKGVERQDSEDAAKAELAELRLRSKKT